MKFQNDLLHYLKIKHKKNQPLVIVCIGTDRATGDCLGPQKKQTKRSAATTTEVSTEKKQTEETTEEEQMTEAPKDTSDWEMQPAENTEPDTGEKIK